MRWCPGQTRPLPSSLGSPAPARAEDPVLETPVSPVLPQGWPEVPGGLPQPRSAQWVKQGHTGSCDVLLDSQNLTLIGHLLFAQGAVPHSVWCSGL